MVELQLPFPSMGIIDLVSLLNVTGDEVKNFDSVKIRFARDFGAFWGHTTDFSFVLTRFNPKQIIGTVAYFTTKIRQTFLG
jgi:hypothetical protein